jgi:iojap-like ribosome-associated protein
MADIAPRDDSARSGLVDSGACALSLAKVLAAHNGEEVVVLDLSAQASWTDRFVVATATSSAHLRGLERFVDEEAARLGLDRLHRSSLADDDEWLLVDYGSVVVHVMTKTARAFYELEKLWFQAPVEHVAAPGPSESVSARGDSARGAAL